MSAVRVISSVLRSAFALVIFAASFGAVCGVIHRALPLPDISIVGPKLAHLAAHHDDYDTLFLGSSRIHYQLVPSIFDQVAAAQGHPVKSFNAGVAGMRPPEDAFFLEQILQNPPRHLRWVFIELAGLRLNVGEERAHTARMQYWHDWPRLQVLARRAFYLRPLGGKKKRRLKDVWAELREPLGDFLEHVEYFVLNETNLGRGSELARRLIDGPPAPPAPGPAAETMEEQYAGWTEAMRFQEMPPAERATYDGELAERRAAPSMVDLGDPVSQDALKTMIKTLESRGAKVFLVVPPTTSKRKFYPQPEMAKTSPVLDFSSPTEFPQLFDPRARIDTQHVNTAGAEAFTRALAERWLATLRQSQP